MKFIDIFKEKEQIKINNELKKLKLGKLVSKNISQIELVNIKELNSFAIKTLRQIAKVRNINTNLSKSDIIYALIRSERIINEKKYLINSGCQIYNKINNVRVQLFNVSPYMRKKEDGKKRKSLYDIGKITKIDRKMKHKLVKELNSISTNLKFMQKRMISNYRDENYANIDDVEYIFGDIDKYYAPILTSSLFDKGFQRYHFRGDKFVICL